MGVSTNTPIVIGIVTFYVTISAILVLVGTSAAGAPSLPTFAQPGILSFLTDIYTFFSYMISFTLNINPILLLILITPGLSASIYMIFSYIRGTA